MMFKPALIALALLIESQSSDVTATGCHSCCLCNDINQIKTGIQEIQTKAGNCTGAGSRTEELLLQQEKLILNLQQDADAIKKKLQSLTQENRLTSPLPTLTTLSTTTEPTTTPQPPSTHAPPPLIGVGVPGAPSRFRLVQEDKSWDDAQAFCRNAGAHLATFTSLDEWRSLVAPLFKMKENEGWEDGVWVGAKGLGGEWGKNGGKYWTGKGYGQVDGSPFPFDLRRGKWGKEGKSPWVSGRPKYDIDEICLAVSVDHRSDSEADHALFGDYCVDTQWFLCEV